MSTPCCRSLASLLAAALLISCRSPAPKDSGMVSVPRREYSRALASEGPVCEHLMIPWSERDCGDTTSRMSYIGGDDIASVSLTVTLRSGRTITRPVNPNADAIFLRQSGLEHFLLRHYDATDPAKAADLRGFISRHFR